MKKIIIPLSGLLLLLSTLAVYSQKVTITGKIEQKGSSTVIYLDTITGPFPAPLASADLAPDGTFKLVAPVKRTDIYKLRLSDQNFMMLILSPREEVSFLNTGATLGENTTIKGSSQSELLLSFIQKIKQNNSNIKELLTKAIGEHPTSLAWLFFMDKFDIQNDFAILAKADAGMFSTYPYNPFVQQNHNSLMSYKLTGIGQPAQDIALPGVDGIVRKLTSLRGKIVLIDFWASWCGPCRRENPNVVALYNKFKSKGFEIFSVSLDKDKTNWVNAIKADNLDWPNHVSDLKYWNSAGAKLYGVSSIPATFLLDREGKIIAKNLRGAELDEKLTELFGN